MTTDETEKLIKLMVTQEFVEMKVHLQAIRDIFEQAGVCTSQEFENRIKGIRANLGSKFAKQIQEDLTVFR